MEYLLLVISYLDRDFFQWSQFQYVSHRWHIAANSARWIELLDPCIYRFTQCEKLSNLHSLKKLRLCKSCKDDDVEYLQRLTNLISLDLVDFQLTKTQNTSIFQSMAQNLTSLSIDSVSNQELKTLACSLSKLETLSISGGGVTNDGIRQLSVCTSLRNLKLDCPNISSRSVQKLTRHLPKLVRLNVSECRYVTTEAALKCSNLQTLISHSLVLSHLQTLAIPSLEHLDVFGVLGEAVTWNHLSVLTRCNNLHTLRMPVDTTCSELDQNDIKFSLIHLHTLHLGSNNKVTSHALTQIFRSVSQLRNLDLRSCGLQDDVMSSIVRFSTLESLDIRWNKEISDHSMKLLVQLPFLRILFLDVTLVEESCIILHSWKNYNCKDVLSLTITLLRCAVL